MLVSIFERSYLERGPAIPSLLEEVNSLLGIVFLENSSEVVNYRNTGGRWPGFARSDHFAVRWTGRLRIFRAGHYYFGIISDDGSKLWINNRYTINNDGLHGWRNRQEPVFEAHIVDVTLWIGCVFCEFEKSEFCARKIATFQEQYRLHFCKIDACVTSKTSAKEVCTRNHGFAKVESRFR